MSQWRDRVRDPLTPLSQWSKESERWATCAVGEQHRLHPKLVFIADHGADDDQLDSLGCAFHDAVSTGNREFANRILDQIEDRVAELLAQQAEEATTDAAL